MNETGKAMLLVHTVFKHEDWETGARAIIDIINAAARKCPGKPRILVLDIEGHRISDGGFDHDMWFLQRKIIAEMLSPWLDEVDMPLIHYRTNPSMRRGDADLPLGLEVDGDEVRILGPVDD